MSGSRRLLAVVVLLVLAAGSAYARDPMGTGLRFERPWSPEDFSDIVDPGIEGLVEVAAVDTYCVVWYNFEMLNWQGWTRVDNTEQIAAFFHVDDFSGLGGGDFGRLVALEGTKSMWCGARPNGADPYLCSWADAPGYGTSWNQRLGTGPLSLVGGVSITCEIAWDCEPDYDFFRVEYDAGAGDWREIASYTGIGSASASYFIPLAQQQTKLRFHFTSDAAWDDQDGLWNTDGACIVDGIHLTDTGGFDDLETFEGASTGATEAGIWHATAAEPFGKYSGLWSNLNDKDPCGDALGTQIVFFVGSPVQSTSYPGLYDTPFCRGEGGKEPPCQNEMVVSPVIDLTKHSTSRNENQDADIPSGELPDLGGVYLRYVEYVDNPGLVFSSWHVRSIDESGCPGPWIDRNFLYWYWSNRIYERRVQDISNLVTSGRIQIALSVADLCDVWYLAMGDCSEHSPAPWFDQVSIQRFRTVGPQWSYRDLDLFQDNFPMLEFEIESYVRADAANDINANDNPVIRPGDSIVVDCTAPLAGGLGLDGGWPAVYLHVRTVYIGPSPTKPALVGPSLAGSCGRYRSDDGVWTIIQGDTARTAAGLVANRYMFDLNDSLFTRGYRIDYYFSAVDLLGQASYLPKYAPTTQQFFEWTCLPTLKSEILFVDDFSGRGSFAGLAENYWMPTFYNANFSNNEVPDKYDVNAPSSLISNGPGSRAGNYPMVVAYRAVVWDAGDLQYGTITEGTTYSDKSNDAQMLVDWMNLSGHDCGLWICGDDVASDLDGAASAVASELMETWCGTKLASNPNATSYYELTGGYQGAGISSPLVKGAAGGIFMHGSKPDSFYVFGGCPVLNQFDVLEQVNNGNYALQYPDYLGNHYYAGIQSVNTNSGGYNVRTMWWGFSMIYHRNPSLYWPGNRTHLVRDVIGWFQFGIDLCCAGSETPAAYALQQNYPNPFNPTTTFAFDMKSKGRVTLKVYSVTGALVRTLVDGAREAGSYTVEWNGTNDEGRALASGVYFYKMETKEYSRTRKMVLLR